MRLEKVATNDALPLKAARCDVIANLKPFCGLETPVPVLNFGGFVNIHYAAPFHSAGIVIIASVDGERVQIPALLFGHLPQFC